MKKKLSSFKTPAARQELEKWVSSLEQMNGYSYKKVQIDTSLGMTQIYTLSPIQKTTKTLVIFPGFRTSSLIWDLDKNISTIFKDYTIFFVETNGQPNLSDGHSPSIKSLDYGKWGAEVFEALSIESAYIAGASFGGLVCMKIALVIPDKVKAAFLLNPGCFRFIAINWTTMYYNLLPILNPSKKNIQKFLNKIIFHKPNHQLSEAAEQLLINYLQLAISSYKDKTEKPYYMGKQLDNVRVPTYMLVGKNDALLPPEKSVRRAKKHLGTHLKSVQYFEGVNHGNECHPPCLTYIRDTIQSLENR